MAQKYFKADHWELERRRIARGWSREDLASKAIVSTRTLDSIMAGGNGTLSTFGKIANALGAPIESILEGYETPAAPKERLWKVTISISTPFDQFDESKDLPIFLSHLFSKLGGNDLTCMDVEPGSTEITVDLTGKQLCQVTKAFLDDELDDLGVEQIAIPSQVAGPMARRLTKNPLGQRVVINKGIAWRAHRFQLVNAIEDYLRTS